MIKKLILILAILPTLAFAQTNLSQGGTGWATSTLGDLFVGTTSKIRYTRLPIGTAGTVLQSFSGQPAWVATSSLFNIASASLSGLLSSTDWSTFNNKAPTASPTFSGTALFNNVVASGNFVNLNSSTTNMSLGGLLYDSTNNVGTDGQYLKSTGTSTLWSTISGFVTNSYASSTFPSFTYASSTYVTVVGNQTIAGDKTLTGSTVLASTTAKNLAINGTGGVGYITLVAQSTNPTTPAAGTLLLHSSTANGFTRLEQDNEATTNLVYGRDNVFIAKNTSGGTISKGQIVYVTGSTGNVPNIAKAQANSSSTLPSVSIAVDDILDNAFGQVMIIGIISSIDTSAFTAGASVWLSTTVAGGLTSTRPSGTTNFVQRVGTILVSGVGNGSILVNIAPAILNMETGTNAATWTGRNVVATGTLDVTGKTTLANASSTNLTVSGQSYLATTTVTGSLTVTGNIPNRVVGYTASSTITINVDTTDEATTTVNQTTTFANPTGTPINGFMYMITITATGTRTLSWGTSFSSSTDLVAPLSVASGTTEVLWKYDQFLAKYLLLGLLKTF